jgi:hypothetical protein
LIGTTGCFDFKEEITSEYVGAVVRGAIGAIATTLQELDGELFGEVSDDSTHMTMTAERFIPERELGGSVFEAWELH